MRKVLPVWSNMLEHMLSWLIVQGFQRSSDLWPWTLLMMKWTQEFQGVTFISCKQDAGFGWFWRQETGVCQMHLCPWTLADDSSLMCTPARTIHQTQRLGATVGCHGSNKRPKHGATGNHWKPLETTNSNDPTGRKLPALSDLARQVSQPGIFTRSASAAWTLDIWSQKSEIYPGQTFKLVILMGHIMLPYIYI